MATTHIALSCGLPIQDWLPALLSGLAGRFLGSRINLGLGSWVGKRVALQGRVIVNPGTVANHAAEDRAGLDRPMMTAG